jgi:hypothetical protein
MTRGIEYTHLLGVAAFVAGRLRVPMFDADLMETMKGMTAGERIPMYTAWLKGWDDANLLAEPEEVTP